MNLVSRLQSVKAVGKAHPRAAKNISATLLRCDGSLASHIARADENFECSSFTLIRLFETDERFHDDEVG